MKRRGFFHALAGGAVAVAARAAPAATINPALADGIERVQLKIGACSETTGGGDVHLWLPIDEKAAP